jgi:hypothetical protein
MTTTIAYYDGSYALDAPTSNVYNVVLVQDVPQLITKPTGAKRVFFSKNADFYANYVLGSELTALQTNGTFASDTVWTKGTGWTIAAGVASSSGAQTANSDLEQTPTSIVVGQAYYVTFTVSGYSAGNVRAVVGAALGTNRAANGTFNEYITATAGGIIALRADLDFIGSIDNLTVIPAAQVPSANDLTGEASELNPTVRDLTKISAISLVTPDASGAKLSMVFTS